jgi:hypothetical protein
MSPPPAIQSRFESSVGTFNDSCQSLFEVGDSPLAVWAYIRAKVDSRGWASSVALNEPGHSQLIVQVMTQLR